jgi:hypothetical protein
MRDNINNHITLLIRSYYIIMERTEIILNYKSTFGLEEDKSASVTHKRIQVSVNSTGILFIYL